MSEHISRCKAYVRSDVFCMNMPLVRQGLQRAISARGLLHSAPVHSVARARSVSAVWARSIRCLASNDRPQQPRNSENNTRGQGFGKASRSSPAKKQTAEVSNTAEALIQSLGGDCIASGLHALASLSLRVHHTA